MEDIEGDVQEVQQVIESSGPMSVEEALQEVLKHSHRVDGVCRGLRESVKCLDRREALLCVLVESCTEKEYLKLVEALCAEHGVNLIKVIDNKRLGEQVGLCKIDRDGNARKVVGASCVVVRDFGEESEALTVLQEYFKNR